MSNDYFKFKQFTIFQQDCAMKVGTDATLLGAWAEMPQTEGEPARILDIGCGSGIIAIMMAQRYQFANVVGIEIDGKAAAQATENAKASPFSGRISIFHCPLQNFDDTHGFDAIVCNPPYFSNSLKCPDQSRTLSRHTDSLSFDELFRNAYRLLTDDGVFSLIIPTLSLHSAEEAAALAGLLPKRLCHVKTKADKPAKRTMLSYTKKPQEKVVSHEIIVNGSEYNAILRDFYFDRKPA